MAKAPRSTAAYIAPEQGLNKKNPGVRPAKTSQHPPSIRQLSSDGVGEVMEHASRQGDVPFEVHLAMYALADAIGSDNVADLTVCLEDMDRFADFSPFNCTVSYANESAGETMYGDLFCYALHVRSGKALGYLLRKASDAGHSIQIKVTGLVGALEDPRATGELAKVIEDALNVYLWPRGVQDAQRHLESVGNGQLTPRVRAICSRLAQEFLATAEQRDLVESTPPSIPRRSGLSSLRV